MSDKQLSMFSGESSEPAPQGKPVSFSLSRTCKGNAQKVFDQWLIPVFIGEWMFGEHTNTNEIVELQNTVRRGGEFTFKTRSGNQEVIHSGEYDTLRIPNVLAFSWLDSREPEKPIHVHVEFTEQDDKTRLKVTIKIPATMKDEKDSVKELWSSRCDALVERLKSP